MNGEEQIEEIFACYLLEETGLKGIGKKHPFNQEFLRSEGLHGKRIIERYVPMLISNTIKNESGSHVAALIKQETRIENSGDWLFPKEYALVSAYLFDLERRLATGLCFSEYNCRDAISIHLSTIDGATRDAIRVNLDHSGKAFNRRGIEIKGELSMSEQDYLLASWGYMLVPDSERYICRQKFGDD